MGNISLKPSDAERAKPAGKGIGQTTGYDSAAGQNAEAARLIAMIDNSGLLTEWEQRFVNDIKSHPMRPVTGRQIFALRDIKDRYL